MIRGATALAVIALARAAHAQPADPYGPDAGRPGGDPALAEQIASALVKRAQELYDARLYVDAKQLAVEALAKSPDGAAAQQAKFLVSSINAQLGIVEPSTPATGGPTPGTSAMPPTGPVQDAPPPPPGVVDRDADAARNQRLTTFASGAVIGGVVGGLFADVANTENTTAGHVFLGGAIGAGAGLLGAYALGDRYTIGDIALVDTFAGIGTLGGLTLGMVMQPAQGEAYSLNAALGAAGGVVTALIAAPLTNTTPRRMARVAGLAAVGGALPFLLYAAIADPSTTADERTIGVLATAGLVGGAYLGFRATRDVDVGLDVKRARPHAVPTTPTVLRTRDGGWGLAVRGSF